MDSILNTIKEMLGVSASDTDFDVDITIYINTALAKLRQLGAGSDTGFMIKDATAMWDDFIRADDPRFAFVQAYIYYTAKLSFDPPTNSSVLSAMKESARELECRIQYDENVS